MVGDIPLIFLSCEKHSSNFPLHRCPTSHQQMVWPVFYIVGVMVYHCVLNFILLVTNNGDHFYVFVCHLHNFLLTSLLKSLAPVGQNGTQL
jgi:hypothetical protein